MYYAFKRNMPLYPYIGDQLMEKFITLNNIGEVRLLKSKRARNINISIKPFKGVRVTVPQTISYEQAEAAINNKLDWIEKHAAIARAKEIDFQSNAMSGDLKTRGHKLVIQKVEDGKNSSHLLDGEILIKMSEDTDLKSTKSHEIIIEGLTKAWRKEAEEYLPTRVEILATVHGFHYQNVKIKNMRSRWGSCSHKNNINLSLHLMRLPDNLIDYVIIHELVHTEIKNHGPKFWTRLNGIVGDGKTLASEIREIGVFVH